MHQATTNQQTLHATPASANHKQMTSKSLAKAGFLLIHNGFRPCNNGAARNNISEWRCQLANADLSGPADGAWL